MKKLIMISSLLLLSACWNSIEIDNEALVHGVGLDKSTKDGQLKVSVEIIKPTNENGGTGGQSDAGQHIILETEAETLLRAARKFIRTAKRRLYFGHARVWVVGKELAEDEFVSHLDSIRRDQMLRINSYLFITSNDSRDILDTSTLYENLTSTELVSTLEQVKFSLSIMPIKLYEFFRLIEGPLENAYIPMIKIGKEKDETMTELGGVAVIKKDKMVGELNEIEAIGLGWLIDDVKGGAIPIPLNEKEKLSYEITKAKTNIHPKLQGEELEVTIQVDIEGTLADNSSASLPTKKWFIEIENKINAFVEKNIRETLTKLQKDLKTDITLIGDKTYRSYPKEWRGIYENWDEKIFANADVTIEVNSRLIHKGLLNNNRTDGNRKRPYNNPYRFFTSLFR